MSKLLIIFVHYNANNSYDKYVDYYLKGLLDIKEEKDMIFISTSKLPQNIHTKLSEQNIEIIERKNEGYDFYSYKLAIEKSNLSKYSSVLICNDSVFGAFSSLNDIYTQMQNNKNDIVGMTQNLQHTFHLQSYFLLFKAKVISDKSFLEFFNNIEIISDRAKVIHTYELGLSKHFIKNGFKLGAYCDLVPNCFTMIFHSEKRFKSIRRCIKYFLKGKTSKIKEINSTHLLWKYLITNYNFPFIKRELIDKNQEKLDIESILKELSKITNYPVELIKGRR